MFLSFICPRGSERLHQANGKPPAPDAHQSPAPARISSLVQAALMSRPIPANSAENRLAECRLRAEGHERRSGTDSATFTPENGSGSGPFRDRLRADPKRDSKHLCIRGCTSQFDTRLSVNGRLCKRHLPKKWGPNRTFCLPDLDAKERFEARQTRQNVLNRVGDSSV